MIIAPSDPDELPGLEEARRQLQRQIDGIDRQIKRRMAALIPGLLPKRSRQKRNAPSNPSAFLARYRMNFAALTAERQPEIDELSATLARLDRAIAELRQHYDAVASMYPGAIRTTPVSISTQREAHVR